MNKEVIRKKWEAVLACPLNSVEDLGKLCIIESVERVPMTTKPNKETEVVRSARIFATAAHAAVGQKRKYSGKDYIVHPEHVASIVASVTDDQNMIAAAWLHDVIEDTKVTKEQLLEIFDEDVVDLVLWLTDVSKPEDGNRATRKRIDREHSASAPARAQTIKYADLISNTSDIVDEDPNFARVYIKEKELGLQIVNKGDKTLLDYALKQIEEAKLKLFPSQ